MRNLIFFPGQKTESKENEKCGKNINVRYIPINSIISNPYQARKNYDAEAIVRLADSIRRYGIIQPLGVRQFTTGKYEIVFGERRLRAAKLIDMKLLPCIILQNVSRKTSCELAFIENALREPLDIVEKAKNVEMLVRKFNMQKNEVGTRLSVFQSEIAFLSEVLRLTPQEKELICDCKLSVGQIKPLLKIENCYVRGHLMKLIAQNDIPPTGCKDFIDEFLKKPEQKPEKIKAKKPKPIRKFIIKDIRVFMNSIDRAVEMVKSSGIAVECEKQNDDSGISYNINVPKRSDKVPVDITN